MGEFMTIRTPIATPGITPGVSLIESFFSAEESQ